MTTGVFGFCKDPDMWASAYHPDAGITNYGRTQNKEVVELIEEGRTELDEAKRRQIYYAFEKILYDNYEDVWLWHPYTNEVRSKKLLGFKIEHAVIGGDAYTVSHTEWLRDGKP